MTLGLAEVELETNTFRWAWSNVVAAGSFTADFTEQLVTNQTPAPWLAQFGLTNGNLAP